MSDKPLVLKAVQEVFDERFEKEMKELDNKTKAEIIEKMMLPETNIMEYINSQKNALSKDDLLQICDKLIESVESIVDEKKTKLIMRYAAEGLRHDELWGEDKLHYCHTFVVPEGTYSIDNDYFRGCDFLKTIVVPDSVKLIYDSAFEWCDDNVIIKCKHNSYVADYAKEHSLLYEYSDKPNENTPISVYSNLTSDYQSEDFQSEIIGGGYPVQICVNTAEKYAYCIPLPLTDNEYTAEYNTAYRDCVNYGKVSCYGYEDYNRLASELADKLDYRNRLEQGESDELDACFAYNDDYENDYSRGR